MNAARRAHGGFSLVELMIAVVLGLSLIATLVTAFSGTNRSATFNRSVVELQENARFALDTMIHDARMAGFQGCIDVNSAKARIRAVDAPTADFLASSLVAHRIDADGRWRPAPPLGFVPPDGRGRPIPGTHALSVQFGNPETHVIQPMGSAADALVLLDAEAREIGLAAGDLAIVADCQRADLFAVTAVSGSTLQHGASANDGPNLSGAYGRELSPAARGVSTLLPQLMRFEANVYYVGDTGRTNRAGEPVLSLYRQSLPFDRPPVELIEGAANLRLRIGHRAAAVGDGLVFSGPTDAALPGPIEFLEIGLLAESVDRVLDRPDTRAYALAGTVLPADPAGDAATGHAGDRRLRLPFNVGVSLRNRR